MVDEKTNIQVPKNTGIKSMQTRKYTSAVLKEMAFGNVQVIDFFREFKQHVADHSKERQEELLNMAQEHANAIGLNVAHKNKLVAQLQEQGIEPSSPFPYQLVLGSYRTPEGRKTAFAIYQKINGCRLTKEMLSEGGLDALREEYERAVRTNITKAQQVEETERQVKIDERKKRFTISSMKRQILIDEIESEKEEIAFLKASRIDEDEIKRAIEVIENMTPEQRELVLDYLLTTERLVALSRKIIALKNKSDDIRMGRDESIIPGGFKRMIEKKGLTEEDVINIFTRIKRIESKADKDEYNFMVLSSKEGKFEDYKDIIEKFFQYVYQPDKSVNAQEILDYFEPKKPEQPEQKQLKQEETDGTEQSL